MFNFFKIGEFKKGIKFINLLLKLQFRYFPNFPINLFLRLLLILKGQCDFLNLVELFKKKFRGNLCLKSIFSLFLVLGLVLYQ